MTKCNETNINGGKIICPEVYTDNRGTFMELWNEQKYREFGINDLFIQDNISKSKKGVLRGVHTQLNFPQSKIVCCRDGKIFDVAVDCRKDSPTFGKWHGEILSAENNKQMYLPSGVAHGFLALEDAVVLMKVTTHYTAGDEIGFIWNDKTVNIEWPEMDCKYIFAEKDLNWKPFEEMMEQIKGVR